MYRSKFNDYAIERNGDNECESWDIGACTRFAEKVAMYKLSQYRSSYARYLRTTDSKKSNECLSTCKTIENFLSRSFIGCLFDGEEMCATIRYNVKMEYNRAKGNRKNSLKNSIKDIYGSNENFIKEMEEE